MHNDNRYGLRRPEETTLFAGRIFTALYWVSQAIAFLYPGVA